MNFKLAIDNLLFTAKLGNTSKFIGAKLSQLRVNRIRLSAQNVVFMERIF